MDALKAEVEEAGFASRVFPKNVQRLVEMQRTANEDAELEVLMGKQERVLEMPVSQPGSRGYQRGGPNMSEVDAVKEAIAARLHAPFSSQFKSAAISPASLSPSKLPTEAAPGVWGEDPRIRVSRDGAQQWPTLKPTSTSTYASASAPTSASTPGRGRQAPSSTEVLDIDTRHQQLARPEPMSTLKRGARASTMAERPTVQEGGEEQEVPGAMTDNLFQDWSWQLMVAMLGTVGVVGVVFRLRPRLGRWLVRVH